MFEDFLEGIATDQLDSSLGKNLWAAMSWNDPGTPCIAILFMIQIFL